MAPVETETRRSSTHKNPLGDELTLPDLLYLPVFADHGRHDRQAGDDVGGCTVAEPDHPSLSKLGAWRGTTGWPAWCLIKMSLIP